MTTSPLTTIDTKGSPPTPATKPPVISISSLFKRVAPRLLLLLVMLLSASLGFAQFSPPPVVPQSAPATEFSAERAMTQLQVNARQSRLIGSPGNAQTRAYLLLQITAMGLEPEVQTTTVTFRPTGWDTFQTGTIHTLVSPVQCVVLMRAIFSHEQSIMRPGRSHKRTAHPPAGFSLTILPTSLDINGLYRHMG